MRRVQGVTAPLTTDDMQAPLELLKTKDDRSSASSDPESTTGQYPDSSRSTLRCAACETVVADERDVFSMSAEGPVGAFVNPAGFLHEIVTVRAAVGLRLMGHAVEKDSWFAGYSWTIVICASCMAHLGWRFDAVEQQRPSVFWGLRRAAIKRTGS